MPVAFNLGQVLGRGDLDIFLTGSGGSPANAFEITAQASLNHRAIESSFTLSCVVSR